MFLADHLHLSQPFMMMPPSAPPLLSLDSLLAYTYYTAQSINSSANITWWWIPASIILVLLLFLIFLWYFIFRNHVNIILDIESGVAPNEDDQPATVVAAAPTKPRLTGQAVEEAFPTFAYGENENCYECAICLEELKDGDKCRMFLPSCNHTFHKACVDLWLSEDNTCPLCRVVLLS